MAQRLNDQATFSASKAAKGNEAATAMWVGSLRYSTPSNYIPESPSKPMRSMPPSPFRTPRQSAPTTPSQSPFRQSLASSVSSTPKATKSAQKKLNYESTDITLWSDGWQSPESTRR
eukprot:TRINITY_DN8607_c0_g1_i2.p2 TRINITY_DN8607_c0_g1~~TRINITY_DN8607_c0_g1_i2.p2  ORF type:complete len:117 (+),score=24.64 TRINITY_DN8607_c0_g1_i2:45-395(+)